MKTLLFAAACSLALAFGTQSALAQSARTAVGDAGGPAATAATRQLRLLCHAHRQRLSEWKAGGSPGRISSPTSALAAFPDDSPARYETEIGPLCEGVPEPDALMLAEVQAERAAVRTRFDNVEAAPRTWAHLPRRQAPAGADVFDAAVRQQSGGKEAQERLAQPIAELSTQAINQQSRPVDFVGLLNSLAGALNSPDSGVRQLALQQIAQQARAHTEGRDLSPSLLPADPAPRTFAPGNLSPDNPGATPDSTADPATRPTGGRLSSQACQAMLQSIPQIPPNASPTTALETVMFKAQTEMNMIDGGCTPNAGVTPAQVIEARKRLQQSYATAAQSCNQIQSGGRQCVATNRFGPGADPNAHLQTPYPKIPVPIMNSRR